MGFKFNPFTGTLDVGGLTAAAASLLYIKLDGTSTTTGIIPFVLGLSVRSDSAYIDLGATANDYKIQWDGSDAVHTITAGDFVFTGGNVGIGTATPGTKLHIFGGKLANNLRLEVSDTSPAAGDVNGAIEFAHLDTDDPGVASKIVAISEGSTGQQGFAFYTGTPSALSERMRIDELGYVGIGTSVPGSLLEVSGAETTIGQIMVRGTEANDAVIAFYADEGDDTGDRWNIAARADEGHFTISSRASGAYVDVFNIKDGSVGIGTTAPATLLHISKATTPTFRLEIADTSPIPSEIGCAIEFAHQDTQDAGVGAKIVSVSEGSIGQTGLAFYTGTPSVLSERMRIDEIGGIEWADGNTIYVPIGGDINTYAAAATAGDTLILASGTYSTSTTIDVGKALNIKGQGIGATIISTTDTDGIKPTVSNVRISDLSIVHVSSSSTTAGIYFGVSTNDVITGCKVRNVEITQSGAATTAYGIRFLNASGMVDDVKVTGSGAGTQIGIQGATFASATVPSTVYVQDADVNVIGSTASYGGYSLDSSATQDSIVYFDRCILTSSGSAASRGIYGTGGDAFAYARNCIISGSTADVVQASSATVQLTNTVLINNTTSGTITYDGDLKTEGLEVVSSATDGGKIRITNRDTVIAIAENFGQVEFYSYDASTNGTGISGYIKNIAVNAGVSSKLTFGTRAASGSADALERMVIDQDGNVGIGITPVKKFHVYDVTQWSKFESSLTTSYGLIDITNTTNTVRLGIESSTGGSLVTGSTAYNSVLGSTGNYGLQLITNAAIRATITNTGNVGIGQTSPTAVLHLKAGTATASTAPLKFTSGTLLTAAEAGVVEFLTDRLTFTGTTGTTRKDIADFVYRGISALRTLDGSDELVDCTVNTFTVTLPTAVGFTKQYIIKNSGTGVITLATTSSQTIDGNASATLTLIQYDSITLRSNGSNWIII